ncbi:wall-associated receptor kinase-like 14 isoform X1 [Populus alba x Populus x berolinensis]|uniref:Wall-associated receptor kinase-like 14 isoform X1 n=1 Tax=Populus alba x Populus x berolinensis TaxID=444605 RepID=A0AAD6WE90_9ROSI|nr:wall-associated receptor kinase-like 14 isoform X1 [Populus alba x Populus x berolinensis]
MILRQLTILFLAIFAISLIEAHASIKFRCNRTCGTNHLPYPFGFSPDCDIHLNCSPNGEMLINEFPVQIVGQNSIKIVLEPKCNRPLQALDNLFTKNYAPKSTNAILLHNCTSAVSPCNIPSINVQTHFESLKCSNNSSLSCFSKEVTANGFFDYNMANISQCRYLLSSISADSFTGSGVSLDIQMMELWWWLQGDCRYCSKDAICTQVESPAGSGFRCQCRDGLIGDGYLAGVGCRKGGFLDFKASAGCNRAKYLSGQCGGGSGVAVLLGGVVAGVGVSLGLFCCLIRRNSASKAKSFRKLHLAEAADINIPIYPYKEIEKATNSFAEKQRIGTGAYGTVYAGKLNSDSWVAFKRIKHGDMDNIEQVMNEIKLISSVSHPNLVRLLGCSIENGEQILVYEFMPNGTLCQHLQRERGDGLDWPVRLAIATDTAKAIAHLHSAMDPPIYHRDIKSSNILLDFHFRSKVADFGLSRHGMTEISHISTAPQGTPGYLDPQYHQNFHLSDKSDVYSFGVVLVEIITAKKVVDFSRPQNEVNLAALATDRIGRGRLDEIIDPFLDLHSDAWTFSSVHKVAEVAFRCLAFHKDMRPSMMEVAAELEQIVLSRWASSEEANCAISLDFSPCSSSSNVSDKPLNSTVKKTETERRGLSVLQTQTSKKSTERANLNSPVSVQDPWLSEKSSPSSSNLLNNVIVK